MSDKLRECPVCNNGLIIEEIFEKNQVARKYACGHLTIEIIPIPKHETVEQWEERTGETYPDEYVWVECPIEWTGKIDYVIKAKNIAIQMGFPSSKMFPIFKPVANHHGKPEDIK